MIRPSSAPTEEPTQFELEEAWRRELAASVFTLRSFVDAALDAIEAQIETSPPAIMGAGLLGGIDAVLADVDIPAVASLGADLTILVNDDLSVFAQLQAVVEQLQHFRPPRA